MSQPFETKTFSVNTAKSTSTQSPSPVPSSSAPYSFLVEWFDTAASLARKFTLTYFPSDSTLELFDVRHHRTFLKRCPYPSVPLSALFLGSQVTIYARTLKVIGYGDESTRARLDADSARTLALIKPSGVARVGAFLTALHEAGLRIGRLKTVRLTLPQAQQFYGDATATPRATDLTAGPSVVIEVVGKGAEQHVAKLLGSLGVGGGEAYESSSARSAESELSFLFSLPSSALLQRCSLLVVKPHAVAAGQAGAVVSAVQLGWEVSAIGAFQLTREAAEEFLEVYKGVVGECSAWVEELSSGQCIAVELVRRVRAGEEEKEGGGVAQGVVEGVRAMAGPYDPDIARQLRKGSLRAVFGLNKVRNAVHVTDLPEDGPLESEFFFSILQQQH